MGIVAGKSSDAKRTFKTYKRQAYHAGSWYEGDKDALHRTLQTYLDSAASDLSQLKTSHFRAIIVPHAGFRFSGPTAAYSYQALRQALAHNNEIRHILVLHPAHHMYLDGCAISGASVLETPLGDLPVDDELRQEILDLSSDFSIMKSHQDEEEHSGEMQYPYLAKVLLEHATKRSGDNSQIMPHVLPIMCGALSNEQEARYGQLLAPIIGRPDVICVISSDFCHWGPRFRYQPTPSANSSSRSTMPIHEFIQAMDQEGMDLIAMQEPGAFANYLKRTKNTICGRHAISVWMQAIHSLQNSQNGFKNQSCQVDFVKYAQSSQVESMSDSSVSYASAVVTGTSTSNPRH